MIDIPKKVIQSDEEEGKISQEVIEMPQDTEAPEAKPYLISFAKYNDEMCEILELDSNKGRKAIETLKTIGTKIYSKNDFQRNFLKTKRIKQEGLYKKLFNGLGQDVEIREINLQQDARIFYFDIEQPEPTFYIIAITKNHLETGKTRR